MDQIYVIGTLMDRKIYTAQFGWIRPEEDKKILSGLIYGREAAETMMNQLLRIQKDKTMPLGIFPVELKIGFASSFTAFPEEPLRLAA